MKRKKNTLKVTHEPRPRWKIEHGEVHASSWSGSLVLIGDNRVGNSCRLLIDSVVVEVLEALLVELKAELQSRTPA